MSASATPFPVKTRDPKLVHYDLPRFTRDEYGSLVMETLKTEDLPQVSPPDDIFLSGPRVTKVRLKRGVEFWQMPLETFTPITSNIFTSKLCDFFPGRVNQNAGCGAQVGEVAVLPLNCDSSYRRCSLAHRKRYLFHRQREETSCAYEVQETPSYLKRNGQRVFPEYHHLPWNLVKTRQAVLTVLGMLGCLLAPLFFPFLEGLVRTIVFAFDACFDCLGEKTANYFSLKEKRGENKKKLRDIS